VNNGSASSCERTIACPAWLALPHVHRTGDEADRGAEIHRFVRNVLTGTPHADALSRVSPEHRELCARIDWRSLGGDLHNIRCEVSYGLKPFLGLARELGENLGRKYVDLEPDEVPGTLDIEGETLDGRQVVIDLKTGFELVDSEDNGQGKHLCACRAIMAGCSSVEFRIAQLRPDGTFDRNDCMYDTFEIDTFCDDLSSAILKSRRYKGIVASGLAPDTAPGDHCRYCPAMEHCPAHVSLVRSMLPTLENIEGQLQSLSVVDAGRAWDKAKQLEKLLDRVMESLKARAKNTPLPLSDGKELRETSYKKQQFVQSQALALLDSLGASGEQIAACYHSTIIRSLKTFKSKQ
jgi:hypothetical protein